jgi:gamma-glutamyltranspeptidase / glutathione hydrolase
MTMNEGAEIYSPGGALLEEGDLLCQPGLAAALEVVAEEGPRTFYSGTLARALLDLMEERGGLITEEDLDAYSAGWAEPVEVDFRGYAVRTRAGLSDFPAALGSLPELRGLNEPERALAFVETLRTDLPEQDGTTNVSVLDADGSACVLTTSLGLGSGDFLPGLDLHLNSMLGEAELLAGPLRPGGRMESMMAPSLAVGADGPLLAIGSAGGSRLRTALVGVAAAVLDEGCDPQTAVDRPRFHPVGRLLHAEPGVDADALRELERRGWTVRVWPDRHHYFGGVSLIARAGAAADPRRSGAARTLP